MEFQTGDKLSVGVLFFNGCRSRSHLARGMGKILVEHTGLPFGQLLKPFGSTAKGRDGLVEIVFVDPHVLADPFGTGEIIEIVFSKDLDGHRSLWGFQQSLSVLDLVFRSGIGKFPDSVFGRLHHFFDFGILFIVGNASALDDTIDKNAELLHIVVESGEYVDMVPRDAT